MRALGVLCAACLSMTAAVAWGAAEHPAAHSHANRSAPAVGANRGTRHVILTRAANVTATAGQRAGVAQAFSVRARATATARSIRIFIARGNRAHRIVVGLYDDRRGRPAKRVASGALNRVRIGKWSTVGVSPARLSAGHTYWLALLGTGGRVAFHAATSGSCRSETSRQSNLTWLPKRWAPGKRERDCQISAQVNGSALYQAAAAGATIASVSPVATIASVSPVATVASINPVATPIASTTASTVPSTSVASTDPVSSPTPLIPVNTSAPAISGTAQQGDVLTTSNGSWTTDPLPADPTSYAYQWDDCNSSGLACTSIASAIGSSYTLKASDVGQTLRSVVTATDAAGSASATSPATRVVTSNSAPGGSMLMGDQNLASSPDSNPSGTVQAFQYTASASGTSSDIALYLSAGTTATQLTLGVYSDNGGRPGALLTSGSTMSLTVPGWNQVPVGSASLFGGTTYWIALLGSGGQVNYLDTTNGSGASYVDSSTGLSSLPSTYSSGSEYNVSPASAYVTGTLSGGSGGSGTGPQIYVAQTQGGSGSGADCADAKPVSWFDNSSNWGASRTQISPGTTVDLCGTISSSLSAQGSGTSSSPITVYWEPGATMSSSDWGGGAAVYTNGHTYLTFNGGNNGTSVQATAEGSGLADQGIASIAFDAMNCTGCTFENLTIANLYVHTSTADTSVDQTADNAFKFSGSDITIADNTMHDVGWALYAIWSNGNSNDQIYGNDIYNVDHGFASTSLFAGGSIGPIYFYDNHVYNFANWDTTSAAYHHDGLHCYTSDSGAGPSTYNGFYIYNNRFDGTVGADTTGDLFMEGGTGSSATPCASASSTIYVFNNVMTSSDQNTTNSYMGTGSIAGGVYNNTVMGYSNTQNVGSCGGYAYQQSGATISFEDNLFSSCDTLVTQTGNGSANIGAFSSGSPDYNTYVNGGANSFVCEATRGGSTSFYTFGQFSSWKTCLQNSGSAPAYDQHSQTFSSAQANLNGDGSLGNGSFASGAGANLTSVCNSLPSSPVNVGGALCTTYSGPSAGGGAASTTPGTARPSTGGWDAGAY